MPVYDEYKPLRNLMRRCGLVAGLRGVWGYALHVIEGHPLPAGFAADLPAHRLRLVKEHLHPWDLDVIARELLLNAAASGPLRLERWADLSKVVNHVRRLDELAFAQPGAPDVFHELHRIAHRQFPWQRGRAVSGAVRCLKVFGAAAMEDLAMHELGMSVRQFLLLGAKVVGHFLRQWEMSTAQDYGVLGIGREQSRAFFDRLAASPGQLRAEIAPRAFYGPDWPYAWNPLERWPLVRLDPAHLDRVVCPLPAYLMRRVSAGLFYDLVRSKDFSNPFGGSFEAYVGEVISATCPPPRFRTVADASYRVRRQERRGVDWVLADGTAQLAIECKTKRPRLEARILSDRAALSAELDELAKAVVQHYRNIRDALTGGTPWTPDGSPIYPLVLTLEDWFLFGATVNGLLDEHVRRRLQNARIPEDVLVKMPYTIASSSEFEALAQVMAQNGIGPVLQAKTRPDTWRSGVGPFLGRHFRAELGRAHRPLFSDEFKGLIPEALA